MKKVVSLKKEYVSVGSSFGGNQNLFGETKELFSKGKQLGGCGVVAISDTVSYLKGDLYYRTGADYRKNFNKTARRILFIPTRFGMTFFQELLGMKHISYRDSLGLKCRLVSFKRNIYPLIYDMLRDDIPVIMCIPRIYGRNKASRSLPFYDPVSLKKVTQTQGHFVVATGIFIEGNDVYLEISSWGRRYFIKFEEFKAFVKKHPASRLGYMMKITRRR